MLCEINGVQSEMNGFSRIYGDNRVQETVCRMLEQRYGPLTVNDGSLLSSRLEAKAALDRSRRPVRSWIAASLRKSTLGQRLLYWTCAPSSLCSAKAELAWQNETTLSPSGQVSPTERFPFPVYNGQSSTVINMSNEVIAHPTVNPFVCEELTRNKFLQYLVLRDTGVRDSLPLTGLVGLGWAHPDELAGLRTSGDSFIVKPLLGYCGKGVKRTGPKVLDHYRSLEGPIDQRGLMQEKYLEDLVAQNDFSFEPAMSVIQPFIEAKTDVDGRTLFQSVRAIVCNGQYVDAYSRMSRRPIVNISKGAVALPYRGRDLSAFCETVIEGFERACKSYTPENYMQKLYGSYFAAHPRSREQYGLMQQLKDAYYFLLSADVFSQLRWK